MKDKTDILGTITVDVTGFFTTHHNLEAGWGELAELTFPAFSQCASYQTVDGRQVTMQKAHWLGTAYEIVDGGAVRGSADRPGLFRRDLAVQFDGRDYWLEPEGLLKQGWFLLDAERQVLLEIQPRGVFRQGAYITVHSSVELDLIVFAYYLMHMRHQEDAAVAATS